MGQSRHARPRGIREFTRSAKPDSMLFHGPARVCSVAGSARRL
ncbi:hypothetical protein APV28_5099 [Comamonas testosteroni]|nr:hypothetical protein APV28_5099 [Comamonas testosteroni]